MQDCSLEAGGLNVCSVTLVLVTLHGKDGRERFFVASAISVIVVVGCKDDSSRVA